MPILGSDLDRLRALLADGEVLVLTGAGISTDSGIPDYRGPTGAAHSHTPMNFRTFRTDAQARRRYWARAWVGYGRIAAAEPNRAHSAVASWQRDGSLCGVITQNVDGLHQAAGCRDVIELHGGLDRVVCLDCGQRRPRELVHDQLRQANPDFVAQVAVINPDGDAELADDQLDGFRMVGCPGCGSDLLKPDVVFFGENVPLPRVQRSFGLVAAARSLIVLGSSLTVMSGLRFVLRAARDGIPIAIVNSGATRGDQLAEVRIDAPLAEVLGAVTAAEAW